MTGRRSIYTRLARIGLNPDGLGDPDAEALVMRITASEVAVGEKFGRDMAAAELEFFPIAHLGFWQNARMAGGTTRWWQDVYCVAC